MTSAKQVGPEFIMISFWILPREGRATAKSFNKYLIVSASDARHCALPVET